ncbi:adenosylcobinamide-GDP ribazoletransferase [Rhodoferax koreense]|uniref:Adenosylcobinamide-GDP ribazoletransferase n=1 Tax=Rhodoferax koreensis TaxID=1842727 RepID=A0A1P8JST8_9BURK|nr:adenosylcobinamide-GDP ribazoletransferase [Rhodoferax koreense]APW36817.1 adenosylcobinamide-GDP ribazoletransferase [Rhodoferax koreense]
MASFVRHYLLAIQFFTRIPVTGRLAAWVGFSPAMLRASAAHFPGVGWLVAAVCAAVAALCLAAWPGQGFAPLVAAVLCTAAGIYMTGGFHEDGLADVADGLGGSVERARALEIMKDSRIGAYGAMALVLALLAKVALLALLGAQADRGASALLAALCGGHVFSRWCPLVIVRSLPHVGDAAQSKSKPLADQITNTALAIAGSWCFVPLALVFIAEGAPFLIAGMAGSLLALWWMRRLLARRLQGFTGDGLGATQQLCEIAFYLGAALTLRTP